MRGLRSVLPRGPALAAVLPVVAAGAGLVFVPAAVSADSFNSTSYNIDASVSNSFGGSLSSSSYKMVSSGGEAVVGDGSSGSYKLASGYVAQTGKSIQLSVQPSSLMVHYPMDEASGSVIYDDAAGTMNAVVNNPSRAAGKIGQALSLSGSSTYATAGAQRTLDVDAGEGRTFSAWFKAGTQSQRTFIAGQFGTCKGWAISMDTGGNVRLTFSADSSSCASPATYDATTSGTTYDDNAWHHVLGTINRPGGSIKLYIDGAEEASVGSIDNTKAAADGELVIGADNALANNFVGLVDEFKAFDYAFSAKDAAREYTAQNAGIPSSLSLQDIVPNTSANVAARAVVQTDAPGYELAISQDHNLSDGTHTISPISGSIASPAGWTEGTTKGLGFTMTAGTGLDAKWGTNPNYSYAAIPGSATSIFTRSGYGGGTKDIVSSQFRLDVPISQVASDYQNTVTYTATVLP